MRLIDLEDPAHVFCGEHGEYENWNIDPDAPTIDAVPVKHGKWIRDEFGARCSECGLYAYRGKFDQPWESPYCPICGARMDADDYLESDYDYVEINPCKGCEDFDGKTCTSHGACGDARMVEE